MAASAAAQREEFRFLASDGAAQALTAVGLRLIRLSERIAHA